MPGEVIAKSCLEMLIVGILGLFLPRKTIQRWFANPWERRELEAGEQAAAQRRRVRRREYRQRKRVKERRG